MFKEIRQDYITSSSVLDLVRRLGICLYLPIPSFQEVRKEGNEIEEQKCGKSLSGNNLTGKMRKIMMIEGMLKS